MNLPKSWTDRLIGVLIALAGIAAGSGLIWRSLHAPSQLTAGQGSPGRVVKPVAFQEGGGVSLEGGTAWINSAPIHLEDLRGKIVVLDFWTYCCINCHHILPVLAKLEEKYKNQLVVIGVHSPKFFAERDTENIRKKVREYEIRHPVINDANQTLWNRFNVQSWPTLVLIDAKGRYIGFVAGEDERNFKELEKHINRLIVMHRGRKELNETPFTFFPEVDKPDTTPLLFPGKVLADTPSNRLFISDTGHHRIVVTDLQGKKPVTIGSGTEGLVDGAYDKAQFNRPQGMCLVDNTLFVADTENHALRAIDLKSKKVTTVAGNGKQTHIPNARGQGKAISLTSPWDVIQAPGTDTLLIAMAGQHQIWHYEMDTGIVGVWAGSGREDITDGTLRDAAFAQPSGLATDGKNLYIADSEVSGIRSIPLAKGQHKVETIVGVGLFAYSDVDGEGDDVRLQHCLGVAYGNGRLYIADTYNNKIKTCEPATRTVKTFVGAATPGSSDEPARFYQPGGLSVSKETLYVADTNNHLIRLVNLGNGAVNTLEIEGLSPPPKRKVAPSFPNALAIEVPSTKVKLGKTVTLDVTLPLPDGVKFNDAESISYLLEVQGQDRPIEPGSASIQHVRPPAASFSVPVLLGKDSKAGDALQVKLSVSALVCNPNSNLCQNKSFIFNVPLQLSTEGPDRIAVAKSEPNEDAAGDDR